MNTIVRIAAILVGFTATSLYAGDQAEPKVVSVVGYLRDSGCVHRFHEVVKPLPNGCLEACVRAGSPLVVLTKDEQVYHPISSEMPDVDVRQRLLPFAGRLVKITGRVYGHGESKSISLEKIEEVKDEDNKK